MNDKPDGKNRGRRRWRWVPIGVGSTLLMSVLGTLAFHMYQRVITGRQLQAAVAAVDQADPGWKIDDLLAARRPAPPEGRNSADVIREAAKHLPTQFPSREWNLQLPAGADGEPLSPADMLANWPPNARLSPALLEQLRRELESTGQAVVEARRLAGFPEGRFDYEFDVNIVNTLIPHAQRVREIAFLMGFDSVLRAEDWDVDGACDSLRAAVNASRALGDEIVPICCLIRISVAMQSLNNAERVLAQGEPTEEPLESLQLLWQREEAEGPTDAVMTIRGERAAFHRLFLALESGQLWLDQVMEPKKNYQPGLWDRIVMANAVPKMQSSHALYLKEIGKHIEAVKAPAKEWQTQALALKANPPDKNEIFLHLLPATHKILDALLSKQAHLRCGIAALAAERFRRVNQRWPKDWSELVPAFLPAVPEDPYDGQPLRLRRLPDGLVVYSLGPDGQDNQGATDRKSPVKGGADLAFRLWDVSQRRQPPPAGLLRNGDAPGP